MDQGIKHNPYADFRYINLGRNVQELENVP